MGAFPYATRKNSASHALASAEAARVAAGNGRAKADDAKLGQLIPAVQDGRLRRILELIESYPSRKIHDLALACNLSESHLQHLFKQCTGFGLGQLLTEHRMRQATGLLMHSNMSIKEIASAIGYEHTSSFTRAFERRFRQTPSCYRHVQTPDKIPTKMKPPMQTS